MPDPVTAVVGGSAVIGAVSSNKAAKTASSAAESATTQADRAALLQSEASANQLDFAKQQYSDWSNIFGPIEQNLSSYYQNLNPDTIASLGLQNIEKEFVSSQAKIDATLAKRGLTESGANVSAQTGLESARMLGRAQVQANAPMVAAQQKANFLSLGLGQQASTQAGINNAYTGQVAMLGQQAGNQLNQAQNYTQQAAAGYTGIGSSIGQGINTYMTYNAANKPVQPTNTTTMEWWQ